ncbi:MAG: GAP family protein, partial [Microthrixaceae bacterium]|nr:GAP family protein [Microthrixaceae bacterium]
MHAAPTVTDVTGAGPRLRYRSQVLAASLAQAVGSLLPVAVAVAISPIPIIAVVVILGTPRARINGLAFAAGWVVGLAAVATAVLVLTGASGADDPTSSSATGANWVQVTLGVALLALAARQWKGRPGPGEQAELPEWMEKVDRFGPGASTGAGLVLSAAN